MNIDVEFHIRHNYPWSKLPANVKQVRKLRTWSSPAATCSRASGLTPGLAPAKGLDLTDPKPAGEGGALGPEGQDGAVAKWDGNHRTRVAPSHSVFVSPGTRLDIFETNLKHSS